MTKELELSKAISIGQIEQYLLHKINIDYIEEKVKDLEIVDENSAKNGLSMALQARKLESAIEESKKEITKPHLDFQRAVNKLVNDVKSRLEKIEEHLKAHLEIWLVKQQDESFFDIDSLEVEDGKMWTSEVYDYIIEDQLKIESVYLKPDPDEIKRAIKEGVRNISGIKIFKTKKLNLRVKN